MEEPSFSHELSLFAKDLFADLMSRHPLFYTLPRETRRSRYFREDIGKCVLLQWHLTQNELQPKLRSDFPRFTKTKCSFQRYLNFFVDIMMQSCDDPISQIILLSAILLEIIGFVHRRGMTHFVKDASNYLVYMLSNVKSDKFHEVGGWNSLALVAMKRTRDYNENQIWRQYLNRTSWGTDCNFGILPASRKIVSPSEDVSQMSNINSKKTSQKEVASVCVPPIEDAKNSTGEIASTPENRESEEIKVQSPHKSPITESSPKDSDLQTSSQIETSPTISEKERSAESQDSDHMAPPEDLIESTAPCKSSTKEPEKYLSDSLKSETYHADPESTNKHECYHDLKSGTATQEEERTFGEATWKSGVKSSDPEESSEENIRKIMEIMADERKIGPEDSTEPIDSEVHCLTQAVENLTVDSVDNFRKGSQDETSTNFELLTTEKVDSANVNAPDLMSPIVETNESLETLTPVEDSGGRSITDTKVKPSKPEEIKSKNTETKSKTPNRHGKVSPKKTPRAETRTSTPVVDPKDIKTPKSKLTNPTSPIFNSTTYARSPVTPKILHKSPKPSPKSTEKSKTRSSLIKPSPEVAKTSSRCMPTTLPKSSTTDSSKHLSTSAEKSKSMKNRSTCLTNPSTSTSSTTLPKLSTKDLSESSKSLPTSVEKSKQTKDRSSGSTKSLTSVASTSVRKHKTSTKDAPTGVHKTKKVLTKSSSNPELESVKEGTEVEESVGALAGNIGASAKVKLDSKLDTKEAGTQRSEETKTDKSGPSISSAKNTNPVKMSGSKRNAPPKKTIAPKTEKPQWRH